MLVISNPEDEHTKVVCDKIRNLGGTAYLFFPEELGQQAKLVLDSGARSSVSARLVLSREMREVNLASIFSVWYRRPRTPALGSFGLDREGQEFALDEWRAALEGMYALMDQSIWVSHPSNLRVAAQKPLQIKYAQELGFVTPHTLITNSPIEASCFIDEYNGRVVVKPTGIGWVYTNDDRDVTYILTNRLGHDDRGALDDIEIAPITIQEEIAKAYEIRANVVGQQIYAIKIDSQKSPLSSLDWRRYDVERTPYTPYVLPDRVERQCLMLACRFGLQFGAIDLVRRPDGEYVFLEINGNGQFLWAEELSGVEVSSGLAKLLTGITPPLQPIAVDEKGDSADGDEHEGAVPVSVQRE